MDSWRASAAEVFPSASSYTAKRSCEFSLSYERLNIERLPRLFGDRKRHQQTDNAVDVPDSAFFGQLSIGAAVHFDRTVSQLPSQNRMTAMVNSPVEHRGLQQLHRRAHTHKALAVFLQRQPDSFLLAPGVEGLDEGAVVGDAHEIVLGADLGEAVNNGLEVD